MLIEGDGRRAYGRRAREHVGGDRVQWVGDLSPPVGRLDAALAQQIQQEAQHLAAAVDVQFQRVRGPYRQHGVVEHLGLSGPAEPEPPDLGRVGQVAAARAEHLAHDLPGARPDDGQHGQGRLARRRQDGGGGVAHDTASAAWRMPSSVCSGQSIQSCHGGADSSSSRIPRESSGA
jgi:hypothetical protein